MTVSYNTIISEIFEHTILGVLVLIALGLLYIIMSIVWVFITEVGYEMLYLIPIVGFLALIGYITKMLIRND